jgi:PilZ domain
MDSKAYLGKPAGEGDAIGGDRRQDRRYQLQLDLRWKLIRRRRVLDTGTGQTVDVSSGGICFDAGRHLPEGLNVELSISWPVLLHNVAPMQLVAIGKIVRCNGRQVAIQTAQHEFRTAGTSAEQRNVQPGTPNSPSMLATSPVFAAFSRL